MSCDWTGSRQKGCAEVPTASFTTDSATNYDIHTARVKQRITAQGEDGLSTSGGLVLFPSEEKRSAQSIRSYVPISNLRR